MFFAVYLSSAAPSFNSDDSPETTLAAKLLGIQHPPGYPLNTITGKIFTLLPAGSAAFRINFMSVFFNILAALMLFLVIKTVSGRGGNDTKTPFLAGVTAAAFYLFSSSAWLQGINAKGSIYSMNAFFLMVCLWAALKAEARHKYLYLFAFAYGLSMGNHWTSMAVAAPAFIYLFFVNRKIFTPARAVSAAVFFFLGAGVYLFVILRTPAAYAWGDIESFHDFVWLIKRAQYAGREGAHSFADTVNLILFYIKNLSIKEYPFLLGLLALPGIAAAFKRFRRAAVSLLTAYIFIVISVAAFATPPENTRWLIKPYLVSSNLFIAAFAGIFIALAASKAGKQRQKYVYPAVFAVIFSVLAVFNNPGYARYFAGYDYAKNISKSLKDNSVFFTEGDMNVGAALYETLYAGEEYVPVIPVVAQYNWYRGQLKRNYGKKIKLPPVYKDMREYIRAIINVNSGKTVYYSTAYTKNWLKGLSPVPEGLVFRIPRGKRRVVISDIYFKKYSYRGLIGGNEYDEFTQRLVSDNYGTAYYSLADRLRSAGQYAAAAKFYEYALLFTKEHGLYVNLGLSCYYAGRLEKAEEAWQKAIKMRPSASINYSNLAFIYLAKREPRKAAEYVKKALELDPSNKNALSLMQKLQQQGVEIKN